MFRFLRTAGSGSREVSPALQQVLLQRGALSSMNVGALRALTQSGGYAGRVVKYFRVFDPRLAAISNVSVRTFADLDTHHDLIVASGHIEQSGGIVVAERAPAAAEPTPSRERATRGDHADDERIVFPGSSVPGRQAD